MNAEGKRLRTKRLFGLSALVWVAACATEAPGVRDAGGPDPASVFDVADRTVVSLLASLDSTPLACDALRLEGDEGLPAPSVRAVHLQALKRPGDSSAEGWVAAVTVWTGGAIRDASLTNSLRLYRRVNGAIRRVATTDESPLVLDARSETEPADLGSLYRCLRAAIIRVDQVRWADAAPGGWAVRVAYRFTAGCGASHEATVEWLVREDRFHPMRAEYAREPQAIRSQSCAHFGGCVYLGERATFRSAGSRVVVNSRESLTPWLSAVDGWLAGAGGDASDRSVRGITPAQATELARYYCWGYGDDFYHERVIAPDVCQATVRVCAKAEDSVPTAGRLTMRLRRNAGIVSLESAEFQPDSAQPDWDAFK